MAVSVDPKVTVTLYAGASTPAKVSASVIDAVRRVEVKQVVDGTSGFKLTLHLQLSGKQFSELPIVKDDTVSPGKRVKIGAQFGSTLQVLIDGVVERHELHPDPGTDDQFTYHVFGKDLSAYMEREEVAAEWPGRSSEQIVTEILNKYSRYSLTPSVIVPASDFTPTVDQWIKQQNASDLAIVRDLGRTFGYLFAIRPGRSMDASSTAYWGPPSRDGTPLPSLALRMGAKAATSTEFAYDAGAAQAAKGGSHTDTDDEQTVQVASSGTLTVKKLATASSTDSKLARTRLFIQPGMSGTLAAAYADAQAQQSALGAARMTTQIDSFAYGTVVTPGSLLPVRGAGSQHDGMYYVESVTHVLERRLYTQSVTMTREGLGATIQSAT